MKSVNSALACIKDNKKAVGLIVLFFLGALLLAFSAAGGEKNAGKESVDSLAEYKVALEEELARLCSSVTKQ